jgi:hypothetical protein
MYKVSFSSHACIGTAAGWKFCVQARKGQYQLVWYHTIKIDKSWLNKPKLWYHKRKVCSVTVDVIRVVPIIASVEVGGPYKHNYKRRCVHMQTICKIFLVIKVCFSEIQKPKLWKICLNGPFCFDGLRSFPSMFALDFQKVLGLMSFYV